MALTCHKVDIALSQQFFEASHFARYHAADIIYSYGIIPAWFVAMLSLVILLLSLFMKSLRKYRRGAWVLVLSLAVGSGLIANVILKDHWGRPRPVQIVEFGGKLQYRPFYMPHFVKAQEPIKSFPSGHATMGFYFFALAFVGFRYSSRFVSYLGLLLAIGLGVALSFARIAQGGHFFSDAVMAGVIMWYTALFFDFIFFKNKGCNDERSDKASA